MATEKQMGKSKRYRVEIQYTKLAAWEPEYYTDSLAIAKFYAPIAMRSEIWAVRVVDQITENIVYYNQR
jgi:hypothetical protein